MKVSVKVKAGSKAPGIDLGTDGTLIVKVRERAIEGAANDAATRALAKHFDVAPSLVTLLSGATSKSKVFEVG